MDAKITKSRLAHYLSYEWVKIVAIIIAAVVLWTIIFTTAETRLTLAQEYNVYNYEGGNAGVRFLEVEDYDEKRVFSYEVIEANPNDVSKHGEELDAVMQTRLSTNEIDAVFVTDRLAGKDGWKYKDDMGVEHDATYLDGFLYSYYSAILPFGGEDGLRKKVETYLNTYFTAGYQDESSLDEQKAEADFRARVKKDKRFKKEEQIAQGVQDEKARLIAYANALKTFNSYLSDGTVALQEKTVYFPTADGTAVEQKVTGEYSLNLCPDETKTNFKDLVSYFVDKEEGGREKTSKNLNLVLFRTPEKFDLFLGEHLLYINKIIADSLTQNA